MKKLYEIKERVLVLMDGRNDPVELNPPLQCMVHEPLTDPVTFDLGIAYHCSLDLQTFSRCMARV